ncbi:MAG: MraY family glycosyltransferase [Bacteroidota bacterium]
MLGTVLLVGSAIFSYLLNLNLFRHARKRAEADTGGPNVIRWASTTKPTVGGISFFVTFVLAVVAFFLAYGIPTREAGSNFLALIIVTTLGFFIGLQDDTYNTRPLLKFLGQVTCAVIMIMYDLHISVFDIPALNYFFTVFWVVGIMNSVNLLDNMDAVTGTVSLIIVVVTIMRLMVFPSDVGDNAFLFVLVACAGAFIGFLIHNWHPSRIYMGDTGSQFLGAFLAFIGIHFFWNFDWGINGSSQPWITRMIVPVMVFIVPIMDTTFVTVGRLMRGQSPFVGGKDHLTHNMSYLGVPQHLVPVALGLVSLTSGALAIFGLRYFLQTSALNTFAFVGYLGILALIFFFIYKRGERIGVAKQRFSKTFQRAYLERQNGPVQAQEKQHS